MRIYGLDFTSAPNRQKPITCIACELIDDRLQIDNFIRLASLTEFEVFLKRPGPWLAGLDFPFGQPRKLIKNLAWPQSWESYVGLIAIASQQEFEEVLTNYRQNRLAGDKHHLRITDTKANGCSPMMIHGVPVGKMFFKGTPRLLRSSVNILPCRPTSDNRITIEAYPALVARKWLGSQRSYKSDDPKKQTAEREAARQEIVAGLQSTQLRDHYGCSVELDAAMAGQFVEDPTGDSLDAFLCAIQAAWAYQQRDQGYGIPSECDSLEGWIVDPELL